MTQKLQPPHALESQHVEWKESWHDEYIKWICGFANAKGGILVIGKNDAGQIIGIPNARMLLELIPNKVISLLGIIVDVNLCSQDGKEYIKILVESYPYPVSYKGQYHYRTGSTKQELKGPALDKFLLKKRGKPCLMPLSTRTTAVGFPFRSACMRTGSISPENRIKRTP